MIGLYAIINLHNRKAYVGSSCNLDNRFTQHKAMLNGKYHPNKHLMSAWDKYGANSFEFKVLKICDTEKNSGELEQKFLECFYGSNLYNLKNDAFGVGSGKSHPKKGKPLTEEHKQKISNTMKGMEQKPHTEKTIQKISKSRAKYLVKTPDGQFYGFASAGKHYGISEVAAKKRCKILKFNWSYERL